MKPWQAARRSIPALALAGLLFVLFPLVASADHCGSLGDCWNTGLAAVLAAVGLGAVAAFLGLQGNPVGSAEDRQAASDFNQSINRDYLQNLIAGVDPGHGSSNCGLVVTAVNNRLGGGAEVAPIQVSADDSTGGEVAGGTPGADIARWNGGTWQPAGSYDDIANKLRADGDGSRGIVHMESPNGVHVINAVNLQGNVWYVDGQTGIHPDGVVTTDPAEHYPPVTLHFMGTYPP